MPRLQDMERKRQIRDYFQGVYAHRINDPNEVKEEMIHRFHMDLPYWHRIRPEFKDMIAAAKRDGAPKAGPEPKPEAEPVVLEIPSDLTGEAKEAVNRLLEENHRLVTEGTVKDVELATLRSQLASCQGRIKTLREATQVLLNSI